jgi:hypothetical protein
MDFAGIVWWQYALVAAVGIGFGVLQSGLFKWALTGKHHRKWLFALKFVLWGGALLALAFWSLPLLVVFVAAASLSLLVGSALIYRKAQREAR